MFTDKISLLLQAGKGGNGSISFIREKFIPKGGPSGGNGGKGGSIILKVDDSLNSLEDLKYRKIIKAKNGQDGSSDRKNGRQGKDLIIKIPPGTLVKQDGRIIFDLIENDLEIVICKGGKGGLGNVCFKSSTHQTPDFATSGKAGEEKKVELELKIIADIGLVGFPNAGKSTFLSNTTNAKPKIGKYPFTTVVPNIGVYEFEDFSRIFIADIPGLIKGAHKNKGLGHLFLKHIERTKILIYVIDVSDNPIKTFETLKKELSLYSKSLLNKPFLIALNKIDLGSENVESFKKKYNFDNNTVFEISALKKINVDEVLRRASCCDIKNKFYK